MSSSVFASARFGRQVVVASAFGMLFGVAAIAQAQTPGTSNGKEPVREVAQTPAAQAPDPKTDPFFPIGDQSMILVFVKADKTADFESVMAKIKEGIAKPDKADDPAATPDAAKEASDLKAKKAQWRKQAEGWSVMKVAEANPNGTVTYIWMLNPAVPNTKYDPTDIIYSNFERADADVIFGKLSGALAGANKWTVTKVLDIK